MGMIEFVWPSSPGEWGAWLSTVVVLACGLATFIMPRRVMRLVGLAPAAGSTFAFSEMRGAMGGFYAGIAFWTLAFHPQPLLYIALGTAMALSATGRIVALLADHARGPAALLAIVIDAILAAFPLFYAFGIIR